MNFVSLNLSLKLLPLCLTSTKLLRICRLLRIKVWQALLTVLSFLLPWKLDVPLLEDFWEIFLIKVRMSHRELRTQDQKLLQRQQELFQKDCFLWGGELGALEGVFFLLYYMNLPWVLFC